MEKVRRFDAELKKLYGYEFMISGFISYLVGGIAAFCMIVVVPEEPGKALDMVPLILYGLSISVYLRPYMVIPEEGRIVSIYEKLRYMPVSVKEIQKVRLVYIRRYCVPMLLANMLAGQLGMLMAEHWSLRSVLYPVAVSGIVCLSGFGTVCFPKYSAGHAGNSGGVHRNM